MNSNEAYCASNAGLVKVLKPYIEVVDKAVREATDKGDFSVVLSVEGSPIVIDKMLVLYRRFRGFVANYDPKKGELVLDWWRPA